MSSRCIECGYLFGFCQYGVGLANMEFDPEVLRRMQASQVAEVNAQDRITYRNYVFERPSLVGSTRVVEPYKWGDCTHVGCFRHQFSDVEVAVRWEAVGDSSSGPYRSVFRVDTSRLAQTTHIRRDCDLFIRYETGLSARRHEELEHQVLFEKGRAEAQWNEQLRQVFARFLERVRQAQTNDDKKRSLEYLAEYLFGTVDGLRVVDRDLRSSAEEVDRLVRNEAVEPFWANLGNPFIVECKNWNAPVGAKDVRDLRGKMESRSIKTAFLIARSGVSGDDYHDARLEIRQALGGGKYIIVLDDSDLQQIADGLPPLETFRERWEGLFRI